MGIRILGLQKKLLKCGVVLLPIIALVYPALINGFPLVYSDSGTYILAAPDHSVPVDRPIGYSLFILMSSLDVSLWLTIFVQAIILFYLIYLVYKDVFQISNAVYWSSATVIILGFATGISNFTSQLMPDIFMSILLLTSAIILMGKQRGILSSLILFFIFLLAVISHFSDLLIVTMIVPLLAVINFRKKLFDPKRIRFFFVLIGAGWMIVPSINFLYGAGFTLARTQNIFMVGRLVEEGIAGDYLHEYCGTKKYSLCEHMNDLPKYSFVFIWDESSPLYAGDCLSKGWGSCWVEKDKEYGQLVKDIITTPKYFGMVVKMGTKSTLNQMVDFKIGVLTSMKENSPPYGAIRKFYPFDLTSYSRSRQFGKDLYFLTESTIQFTCVCFSIVAILIILLIRKARVLMQSKFWSFTGIMIIGIIMNALICGNLSTVVDRYQARIIWLLPLLSILAIALLVNRNANQLNKVPND